MYSLTQFLNLYDKKATKNAYKIAIVQYFKMVYGIEDKKDIEYWDSVSLQYLEESRDKFADLKGFLEYLKGKYTSKSIGVKFPAIKEWLGVNDFEPSPSEKRILKKLTPASKSRSEEEIFTRENIRRILNHLPIHGKALILVLASSGMRIGETLELELEDIKFEEKPTRIAIRGENTKTGDSRASFISSEALEVLKEWLKVRGTYLKASQNKNKGLVGSGRAKAKPLSDNRVFPFSVTVVLDMFHSALNKAGLNGKDRETRRLKYRVHGLRKFFRTQLATVISVDIVEAIMGHSGYLTGEYRRYTVEELAAFYQKGEHVLLITPPDSMIEIASEVKHGLERNRELLEDVFVENKDLKKRISSLEILAKTQGNIISDLGDLTGNLADFMQLLSKQPEVLELIKRWEKENPKVFGSLGAKWEKEHIR